MTLKHLAIMAVGLTAAATLTAGTPDRTSTTTSVDLSSRRLTPEALWAMGRIGDVAIAPSGKTAVYAVRYYDVKENNSRSVLYLVDIATGERRSLTAQQGSSPAFINNGRQVAFLSSASGASQVWVVDIDGGEARQWSHATRDVEGFLFSPTGDRVILIHNIPTQSSILANDDDLPQASGMVIQDLMYKHWDQYVTEIPHPFVAAVDGQSIATEEQDILEGEPYECPMLPFGGTEQLAWSPDGKAIAYTCRKKTGRDYAISTDSDIFLYEIATRHTRNLCKPEGYVAPTVDPTTSLEHQDVNKQQDAQVGYDQNPQFSPDGRYLAWSSMERDGYESDRQRICVYEISTGKKTYVTEGFQSDAGDFLWAPDSKTLYFAGVWHGKTQVYRTTLRGEHHRLTDDLCDYALVGFAEGGKTLIAKRQSMQRADELYRLQLKKETAVAEALTEENRTFYDALDWGDVKERWVKTVDGKEELCWVIYPPHFDPNKKYPALLFCEGGPQSPVSQFWSYRWNFQIMAANDYIIIAPNRRGLPGFGMDWLEEISGDYAGLCMQDYLSAIDDLAREPYVDENRLGAVGASFGGFSVYWLAGHHEGRFKCFIAHDGIYNTQQQYVETDELWFPNWDLQSAPWKKAADGQQQKAYADSPHLSVDKWDTPILCIHGQRDFRIEYTQAESAFSAARQRGIDAQLLLFPDENHWVLKPQNGILWQRTFFRWLDKYLK